MTKSSLTQLERQAVEAGLLLRLQVRRPVNLWAFRVVVAREVEPGKVLILAEMKGWAYKDFKGLQLDTMYVNPKSPAGVGHLIWAATMSWALENTPCRQSRLLAILDDDHQHSLIVRYFVLRGFKVIRNVGSALYDLPLRMVWGGAGSLMVADCMDVHERSCRLLRSSELFC